MTDQEVMSAAVDAAQERIRYRDLIRELAGALEWCAEYFSDFTEQDDSECELFNRCLHSIARAKKELGE